MIIVWIKYKYVAKTVGTFFTGKDQHAGEVPRPEFGWVWMAPPRRLRLPAYDAPGRWRPTFIIAVNDLINAVMVYQFRGAPCLTSGTGALGVSSVAQVNEIRMPGHDRATDDCWSARCWLEIRLLVDKILGLRNVNRRPILPYHWSVPRMHIGAITHLYSWTSEIRWDAFFGSYCSNRPLKRR